MKLYEFQIEGSGVFPFDMLRYDSCWPHHEKDSALIHRSCIWREPTVVNLVGLRPPTIDRWLSFGWTPKEIVAATRGSG